MWGLVASVLVATCAPDVEIRPDGHTTYLRRWWLAPPRARWFCNVYLHQVLRSDDDRALHDHPWPNVSIVLRGVITEVLADGSRRELRPGSVVFRRATTPHRLEVSAPAWSLFLTGPKVREWGFHCPDGHWVHWRDFTSGPRGEYVGRGCGEGEA